MPKKCLEITCYKIPGYNFKGEKKGIYCVEHKKTNMIDVKHKRCLIDDCNITALYNFREEKKGLYCSKHKLNKKGICVLKKSKKDEWIKRLETLVSIVKYWTNSENFIDKTIKIIQLFYDCDIYKNSKN
jgi:hypothetical protein